MIELIFIIIVFIVVVIIFEFFFGKSGSKPQKYRYKQKEFFMSRAEHECYNALVIAVGDKYHVFPQVHLSSIVDNKVVGQNWKSAFRHTSQKSVDFVLCDKEYISPKLAIELDDKTHEREDRIERDEEVGRVLREAKLPLLRLVNQGQQFDPQDLIQKITGVLDTLRL